MKIGLVLSGGGAKGAYQAGVVKALAEANIEICVLSGASIGALNGAIIAASSTLQDASNRLSEVWQVLADSSPLEFDHPKYLGLLVSAGLTGLVTKLNDFGTFFDTGSTRNDGLYSDARLRELLQRYLDPAELGKGLPLYISLFKHRGNLDALSNLLKGDILQRYDTRESDFQLIQELSHSERFDALLASAAIPLAFEARKVKGTYYSDGGQGGYRQAQGNTPITPLLNKGLDAIIVTHLSDGSLWSANDFPNENILELRPKNRISNNGLSDMLGFGESKLLRWVTAGYMDTRDTLSTLNDIASARAKLQASSREVRDILNKPSVIENSRKRVAELKTSRLLAKDK